MTACYIKTKQEINDMNYGINVINGYYLQNYVTIIRKVVFQLYVMDETACDGKKIVN